MAPPMLDIAHRSVTILNGTAYEGGGGLIRDCISYAAILNKPIKILEIRGNRPGRGGLRIEHTVAIDTMKLLSNASVHGNEEGSKELVFVPHTGLSEQEIRSTLDIRVEGSAAIFMLAILPYVLFSRLSPYSALSTNIPEEGIKLRIRAGTFCIKAPSILAVQQVILPTLSALGLSQNVSVAEEYEQGWHTEYVTTPGLMTVWIKPLRHPLQGFALRRRGNVVRITATAHAPADYTSELEMILREELNTAVTTMAGVSSSSHNPTQTFDKPHLRSYVDVQVHILESNLPEQFHIFLAARTERPTCYLGYEQVYPQRSGFPDFPSSPSTELLRHLARVCIRGLGDELRRGSAVDDHMEDMLVLFQSLAQGFSSTTPVKSAGGQGVSTEGALSLPDAQYHLETASMHVETSWWIANQMTGVERVQKDEQDGCHGIGLGNGCRL